MSPASGQLCWAPFIGFNSVQFLLTLSQIIVMHYEMNGKMNRK